MYRPGPVMVNAVKAPPATVAVAVGVMRKLPPLHVTAKVPFVPPAPGVIAPTLAWVRPRGTLAPAVLGYAPNVAETVVAWEALVEAEFELFDADVALAAAAFWLERAAAALAA